VTSTYKLRVERYVTTTRPWRPAGARRADGAGRGVHAAPLPDLSSLKILDAVTPNTTGPTEQWAEH